MLGTYWACPNLFLFAEPTKSVEPSPECLHALTFSSFGLNRRGWGEGRQKELGEAMWVQIAFKSDKSEATKRYLRLTMSCLPSLPLQLTRVVSEQPPDHQCLLPG